MRNKYRQLQKTIYILLDREEHKNMANFRIKLFLAILTIVAVSVVVLDSFPILPYWWWVVSILLNLLITGLFTIEYILRVWVAPLQFPALRPWRARLRYLRKPSAIIDLVAVLPFYLMVLTDLDITSLRTLWILRLFVLLKFNRYFHTLDNILVVMKRKRWELVSSLLAVGSLMLVSSAIIYAIENPVQPDKFRTIFSGFWWAISTLLTIGYGDIYPITAAGKLLASVVAILGVGLIAVPTGIIGAGYVEEMQEQHSKRREALLALQQGQKSRNRTNINEINIHKKRPVAAQKVQRPKPAEVHRKRRAKRKRQYRNHAR